MHKQHVDDDQEPTQLHTYANVYVYVYVYV